MLDIQHPFPRLVISAPYKKIKQNKTFTRCMSCRCMLQIALEYNTITTEPDYILLLPQINAECYSDVTPRRIS